MIQYAEAFRSFSTARGTGYPAFAGYDGRGIIVVRRS
jgi:hypothetical protein